MSSLSSTPLTSFSVARAVNLQDYVVKALGTNSIESEAPTENQECFNTAKEEFLGLLTLEPEQMEKYNIPGKKGFFNLIYTTEYNLGDIRIKRTDKAAERFAELEISNEKMVFSKYSDKYKTIGLKMSFNGTLTNDAFTITEGTLDSNGMICSFK
ncbi:MAG: hypothetical protein Q7K43_02910 [Candidatus Woesearchaeota archaeon]|nr:hypothetical protein [Candidatus Woesearchaeota archaeon]